MATNRELRRVFVFKSALRFLRGRKLPEPVFKDLLPDGVHGCRDQQLRGFYSTELYFHELKRAGAVVHAPCVNNSDELTNINFKDVYIGLVHIKSLERDVIERILDERSRHSCYVNLEDFISRTAIGQEQLNILIRVGGLRFTGKNKKELLWEANFLHKRVKQPTTSGALFNEKPLTFKLPELYHTRYEDALDEIELLGFPLCDVFSLVDADPAKFVTANQLPQNVGNQVKILCYYITEKPVRTVKGQLMFFGTFIDKNGDWVDSVHFPDTATKQRLTGKGFYHIRGKVLKEFGVYSIDVNWMQKIGLKRQEV